VEIRVIASRNLDLEARPEVGTGTKTVLDPDRTAT
jgi:hypothetical protein